MSVDAKPRALHPPLSGGSEGATVKLRPMLTGEVLVPPDFGLRVDSRLWRPRGYGIGVPKDKWYWVPVPAFLLEHPTAGLILVDTGFHGTVAIDPSKNLGRVLPHFFKTRVSTDQSVPKRLEALGSSASAVQVVIMTHLHNDHASGISQFPDAVFVVGEGEWRSASGPRPMMRGYVHSHFDFAFDFREARFRDKGVGSYASFGRSIDLFGDGSITLCYTPGHSLGHMAVIARLKDREFLIAGDAAFTRRNFRELKLPTIAVDEHRSMVTLKELQLYEKQMPDAVIVPSHDTKVWSELEPLYE